MLNHNLRRSAISLTSCRVVAPSILFLWSMLFAWAVAADPAFTLVVDTSKPGSSNSNQFTLPLNSSYTYNFTVNWGDGPSVTITAPDDVRLTHTYASAGIRTIKITEKVNGGFPTIYFNESGDCQKVTKLANWGSVNWVTMLASFAGCSNMEITASDSASARTGTVSDFSYAWKKCAAITSFPALDTRSATTLVYTWQQCSGLTDFPMIDTHAVTNITGAWGYCPNLHYFPTLDTSAVTNFSQAWFGSGIYFFPWLDTRSGTSFSQTWAGCSFLSTFPALDTSAGTSFRGAWMWCSNLYRFPAINTSAGTDFTNAWYGCTKLNHFPMINTSAGTQFYGAWGNCKSLTSLPQLNLGKMIDGEYCLEGTRLATASYRILLKNLAVSNMNKNVKFSGGLSTYDSDATSARTTLTSSRGWTITDGGLFSPGSSSQNINFPNIPTTIYGNFHTLSATASSGLPITYTVVSGPGMIGGNSSNVVATGVGTVTVQADQTGNATYRRAVPVQKSFVVTPATLTFKAVPGTMEVGQAVPALGYQWLYLALTDTIYSIKGTPVVSTTATSSSPVGDYPISVSIGGATAENYTLVPEDSIMTVTAASSGGGGSGGGGGGGGGGGCGLGGGTAAGLLLGGLFLLHGPGFRRRRLTRPS